MYFSTISKKAGKIPWRNRSSQQLKGNESWINRKMTTLKAAFWGFSNDGNLKARNKLNQFQFPNSSTTKRVSIEILCLIGEIYAVVTETYAFGYRRRSKKRNWKIRNPHTVGIPTQRNKKNLLSVKLVYKSKISTKTLMTEIEPLLTEDKCLNFAKIQY